MDKITIMVEGKNAIEIIRQMLNDWNNATPQQRQNALAAAKTAELLIRRPK